MCVCARAHTRPLASNPLIQELWRQLATHCIFAFWRPLPLKNKGNDLSAIDVVSLHPCYRGFLSFVIKSPSLALSRVSKYHVGHGIRFGGQVIICEGLRSRCIITLVNEGACERRAAVEPADGLGKRTYLQSFCQRDERWRWQNTCTRCGGGC